MAVVPSVNSINILDRFEYIAAQGPLDDTLDDFLQMIFEQQIALIVMLCSRVDIGKVRINLLFEYYICIYKLIRTYTFPRLYTYVYIRVREY